MVLKEKHTTVAYRCPFCGSGVMSAVGLFGLSADMVKLKCPCGKSEMQIVRQRESAADGTVRLTVPCLLCPKPHTFTLRDAVFFSDDLFTLPCPYSDVNICFTGEINRVKAELARTELELLDMLEQNGIADFSALHGDERDLGDPQVREVVLYVIRELEAEAPTDRSAPPMIYRRMPPNRVMRRPIATPATARIATRRRSRRRGSA